MRSVIPLASFALFAALAPLVHAGPADPTPHLARQPDGEVFWRVLRGDEHDSRYETLDGFTVVPDDPEAPSPTWVYAELDAAGHLAPTPHVVGRADPELARLAPHLRRLDAPSQPHRSPPPLLIARDAPDALHAAPSLGAATHLVVLAAFSDHWDSDRQTVGAAYGFPQDRYDALMNEPGHAWDGANGSLADYFDEASNGQLRVRSVVTAWVRLPDRESRYANADGSGGDDGGRMMRDALAALEARGFDFAQTDADGDGWVDMLTVIHSGWDAADSGNGQQGHVWSHASAVAPVTYDGVRAGRYTTIAALRGAAGNAQITRIGTACHELGHFLGIRDFYDTDGPVGGDGSGLGNWSIMGGGGWLGGATRPGPFDAYTRSLLGWVTPRRVHSLPPDSGYLFPLGPSGASTDGVLRVDDGFADNEYLLVEHYGDHGDFHRFLPSEGLHEGLAIWHIDERRGDNNSSATPTLMRARLVEADGDASLTTANGPRSEVGDLWDPGAGDDLLDESHPSGGAKRNDGQSSGVAIQIGGTPGDTLNVNPRTRAPWLLTPEGALVGLGEAVALRWGAASGATGYRLERGVDAPATTVIDDAEDRERWLSDWQARGSWQRFDHRDRNAGGAADGNFSFAAVAVAWSSDEAPALIPQVTWREGHFVLTYQHPVWITASSRIRWQEKRIHKDGSSFHRLQVKPWEGGAWQTVYRKDDSWALWWSSESVGPNELRPFWNTWVQLRFEVVVEAFSSDLLWPHSGVALDRIELSDVTVYRTTWSPVVDLPAGTTEHDAYVSATAGDVRFRVRALGAGGALGPAGNSVRVTASAAVDRVAPGAVADLRVTATTPDSVSLAFTACGDDGMSGAATVELRRFASAPTETTFDQGALVPLDQTPSGGSSATARATGLAPRSTWFFAARCRDEVGNRGPLGDLVSATTPNLAPASPTLTGPADGATGVRLDAALTWQNGARAGDPVSPTLYSVVVFLSTDRAAVEQSSFAAAALVTDSLVDTLRPTLSPDTTYYWRVTNSNATGSASSPVASFRTRGGDSTPPGRITDISISQLSGVSALVLWTAPGDDGASGRATRYDLRVARAPLDEASFALAQPLTVPAPVEGGQEDGLYLVGLTPQTKYWLAIKTQDEVPNVSALSSVVTFTTLAVEPPATPSSPSPTDGTVALASELTALTWVNGERTGAPPDRARQQVQVFFSTVRERVEAMALGDHPDHPSALVAEGPVELTSWSPGPLAPGQTYYWRVVDHNAGGATAGPVWSFRVELADQTPPARVDDLRVTDILDDRATLRWTAPGDDGRAGTAARYELRLADFELTGDNLGAAEVVFDVPTPLPGGADTTWELTGLEPGTRYGLALTASDETGRMAPFSEPVHFTTTGGEVEPDVVEPGPDTGDADTREPDAEPVDTADPGLDAEPADTTDAGPTDATTPGPDTSTPDAVEPLDVAVIEPDPRPPTSSEGGCDGGGGGAGGLVLVVTWLARSRNRSRRLVTR